MSYAIHTYSLARWRNRWGESCDHVMDLQVLQQFLEEKVMEDPRPHPLLNALFEISRDLRDPKGS